MAFPVKCFSSTQVGSPVLSGSAGTLISLLDTCLVSGFGLQAVSSCVVAAGVATLTVGSTPSAVAGSIILVAGATPSGLNGEQRVTAVTGATIAFATAEANGTATGSITVKVAPVGWAKEFTGTNLAVYRSSDVTGTRLRLRVDDTSTTLARVVGYETMTDVSTGLQAFPSAVDFSGGLYWHKAQTANATARPWYIVADGRTLYIYLASIDAYVDHGDAYVFGDIESVRPGEAFTCVLTGSVSAGWNAYNYGDICRADQVISTGAYIARSFTSIGGSQPFHKISAFCVGAYCSGYSGYSSSDLAYPNGPDNGLITSQVQVLSNSSLRGILPGLLHTPQTCMNLFNTGDRITGAGNYSGRTLLALRSGGPANYAKSDSTVAGAGVCFLDITGPWR